MDNPNKQVCHLALTCALLIALSMLSLDGFSQSSAKYKQSGDKGLTSESYLSLTFNGAGGSASVPGAIYFEGKFKRTYATWVDNYGDVHVGYYDHDEKTVTSQVVYDNPTIGGEAHSALTISEEGRLMVFYKNATAEKSAIQMIKSEDTESVASWMDAHSLKATSSAKAPFQMTTLSNANGGVYIFWPDEAGEYKMINSADHGNSWSKPLTFLQENNGLKISGNGKDKVHAVIGYKRGSILYTYMQNGAFFKADGTKIKSLDSGALTNDELDNVMAQVKSKGEFWVWDITQCDEEKPIIGYSMSANGHDAEYRLAQWVGDRWSSSKLINTGGQFPVNASPTAKYVGGMSIDRQSANTVYLSVKRKDKFEIEKWTTKNGGKSWKVAMLTSRSTKDNVRPFPVIGSGVGKEARLLWLQNTQDQFGVSPANDKDMNAWFLTRPYTAIKLDVISPVITDPLNPRQITDIMRQVADWQLANPRFDTLMLTATNWHYGAFYIGLRALYELTEENRYQAEMINIGQAYNWQLMDDIFHADRLAVVDNWAWLSGLEKDRYMMEKSRWALDIHLAQDYKKLTDVHFKQSPYKHHWWTWCDALFMAPPSFVQMWKETGATKYLDYMSHQWWTTSDYLYSEEDSLFFRDDRYFEKRSNNNKKIFWSRGNGWVIAGLARILDQLPEDFPYRKKFEKQYQEMANKLLSLQDEDGMWRVSLIDPEYLDMGESSGSAFYTFALAWGINNGMLDAVHRPAVEKAWKALCDKVNQEGRLGYVQQVAGDPYPFQAHESHVYASGAFLLAGKEMFEMQKGNK